MTSAGQSPMSRLQVKSVSHVPADQATTPLLHAIAPSGIRQRCAIPPPSVSLNTSTMQSPPSTPQMRA